MHAHLKLLALALCAAFMSDPSARAQRQMESLSRGLVAMRLAEGGVFVSWRLLGTDPASQAFNLYRSASGGAPVRVNPEPIADPTCLIDREAPPDQPVEYSIRSVLEGRESKPTKPVRAWDRTYLEIPIQPLPDYRPGDASVADLDGDGDYEIVLHQVSRPRDNAFAGITGTPVLDAYELDGTRLWRIDLGINIREGEHYTQFMVYDLDGDGRAELACKTADGTRDGAGTVLGDPAKDWRNRQETSRKYGRILEGPEHFTIFDGRTGAALKTADYIPGRDPIDGWGGIGGNGGSDDYGNRCDRFLACIAYLDGQRPSAVMCRGVYGRTVIAAWDWRNGTLSNRWIFDSGISRPPFANASPFSGMGGHSLAVADVDGDGKDEIIYHAMTVDDDGRGLYSTGRRHGDTMHLGDFDPDRPGLELFLITENEDDTVRFQTPGAGLHDARTGQPIWTHSPGIDVAAAMVADIDPRHRGCESWDGPGGLRDAGGRIIGPAPRSTGWAIWWDGDLLRELLSGSTITKWNWNQGIEERLFRAEGWSRSRAPTLAADLLGDWREEVIFPSPDGRSLRLYSTTVLTRHRLPTLMHDPQYRLAVAAQNVVYNKTPQPGFYLGEGMAPSPGPSARLR
ncbi:MAG TPA: rhamnogalacturonan lyase [Candidatus Paceibacterota bacterium]|nr:rhamnogalacturonan lyase [Verrucomicrobiota bacterium]HRZ47513.1 rhamnogalacturonan lyase [Candidatus Paceibacterota bacterium]HRZ94493.1 rhamnogalacturonan lyase [Candidatus Paceibacterota bacterium]